MLFPTRPIRSTFGVVLLLWTQVTFIVAPSASPSVLETECHTLRKGLTKALLVAPLSDRFLLLTDNRFLFELPLKSWHSDKNKLHLNNGTRLEGSATWSDLAGVVSNAVDNYKLTTVAVVDGSSEYVWASPLNGPSVVCKIGDSKCSQASTRSVPLSGGSISSSEALTFYTLNQNHLSKCSLSSVGWRVPGTLSTSFCSTPTQHLCTTQEADQIQVSDVDCQANSVKWDIKTGFTDGDRFHLFTNENVYILNIPTGSETVTLTTVSLADFFECNQESKRHKRRRTATICAVVVLLILAVLGVGVCVYYKRKQQKQAASRLCGNSASPTGGNVISSNKQNNSKLKGPRGSRFSSSKGGASFGKVATQKQSSGGIKGTKVHSTRRVTTSSSKVKVKVSSIPRRNTSRRKANRTSSLKANKVATNSRRKLSKASKLMTKQKEIEKLPLSKRIDMACTLGFD